MGGTKVAFSFQLSASRKEPQGGCIVPVIRCFSVLARSPNELIDTVSGLAPVERET